MEVDYQAFYLSNYQDAPLVYLNSQASSAGLASFVAFPEAAPARGEPTPPPVALRAPAASAAVAAEVPLEAATAAPAAGAPARSPAASLDLGAGEPEVLSSGACASGGHEMGHSASNGSLAQMVTVRSGASISSMGRKSTQEGALPAVAAALAAAEAVAAKAAAAAAAAAAPGRDQWLATLAPEPEPRDGASPRGPQVLETKPLAEVGGEDGSPSTPSMAPAQGAPPEAAEPAWEDVPMTVEQEVAPASEGSEPAAWPGSAVQDGHVAGGEGLGDLARAALDHDRAHTHTQLDSAKPMITHSREASVEAFADVEAQVAARLDAFFADERLWRLAYQMSTSGRASPSHSPQSQSSGGRCAFRVQVPKPYPGVQYRKSRNLEDRYPRYAANGVTVTGVVVDNGEWLQIKSNVFLPMRVGAVRILELQAPAAGAEECAGTGGPPQPKACLCCGGQADQAGTSAADGAQVNLHRG